MSTRPLVSVVVIFLNAERFLEESLASIFAQTYDRWELLLVDDGSTDGSSHMAQRYAAQHPGRVRYLEHADHGNRGMSASRNLGIQHGRGEFLAFLDADDVWVPRKLERQVAILESVPEAGTVYGLFEWWYSWTEYPDDRQRDTVYPLGVETNTLIRPPTLLVPFLRDEILLGGSSGIFVRRQVVDRLGGFEEQFPGLYEDAAFHAKVLLRIPVVTAAECWFRYRQHPDSCNAVAKDLGRRHVAQLQFLTWLQTYLRRQGIDDREISQALNEQIWLLRHPTLRRFRGFALRTAARALPHPIRRCLRAQWPRLANLANRWGT